MDQEEKKRHAIEFADKLLNDYTVSVDGSEGDVLWKLDGTYQHYTSEELYNKLMNK